MEYKIGTSCQISNPLERVVDMKICAKTKYKKNSRKQQASKSDDTTLSDLSDSDFPSNAKGQDKQRLID